MSQSRSGAIASWGPVVATALVIFGLSSIPGDRLTLNIFRFQDLVAHALVFGALAWLLARALERETGWPLLKRAGVVVILAGLYGVSDEIHQAFVPLRNPDWRDAAADLAGAVIGAGSRGIRPSRDKRNTG